VSNDTTAAAATDYKTWMCLICGWIYDEAEGLPEEGIAAGARKTSRWSRFNNSENRKPHICSITNRTKPFIRIKTTPPPEPPTLSI